MFLQESGRLAASKRVEEALRRVKGGQVKEVKEAKEVARRKVKRPAEIEDDPRKKGKRLVGKRGEIEGKSGVKVGGRGSRAAGGRGEHREGGEGVMGGGGRGERGGGGRGRGERSLVGASCGFVVAASVEDVFQQQKEERERKAREAKARAAEIFKKSQLAKKQKARKKIKRPERVVTQGHGLSESDSD